MLSRVSGEDRRSAARLGQHLVHVRTRWRGASPGSGQGWPTDAYTFVHVTRYNGDTVGSGTGGKSRKWVVVWPPWKNGGQSSSNKWLIKSPSPLPNLKTVVVVNTPDTARV
jgi:hypothetical protein